MLTSGGGDDTALVDQHDHVSDSCETVPAAVIVGPSVADLRPSLAFKPGAALEVDATDDRGVRDVRVLTGDKELCVATRAPYACAFTPRVEDAAGGPSRARSRCRAARPAAARSRSKVGRKTRTGTLSRACTYRIVLPAGGRFVATYRGTAAIEARRSAARTVR